MIRVCDWPVRSDWRFSPQNMSGHADWGGRVCGLGHQGVPIGVAGHVDWAGGV